MYLSFFCLNHSIFYLTDWQIGRSPGHWKNIQVTGVLFPAFCFYRFCIFHRNRLFFLYSFFPLSAQPDFSGAAFFCFLFMEPGDSFPFFFLSPVICLLFSEVFLPAHPGVFEVWQYSFAHAPAAVFPFFRVSRISFASFSFLFSSSTSLPISATLLFSSFYVPVCSVSSAVSGYGGFVSNGTDRLVQLKHAFSPYTKTAE